MSLDYPFFDELQRQRHPAARWWRIGDSLYYLGLLSVVPSLVAALMAGARCLFAAICGVAIFFCGVYCKGKSYRMAARDGINVNDY